MINATISCPCIKWSPYGVLWIQRHHPPLMRTWWPREDLSRQNTHFRPNLKFTSVHDKRDNFLSICQMVPLRDSMNPMTPPSPQADLMAQRRHVPTKYTFSTKLEVLFCTWKPRQLLVYISNGPPTGFCESNDTTLAVCGLGNPEKTSPDEIHIFNQTWSSLLYMINGTTSCLYIKWSPYGVLWI